MALMEKFSYISLSPCLYVSEKGVGTVTADVDTPGKLTV
jgi:hypothetical protein